MSQIIAQHRTVRTSTIQLVDRLESGTFAELREGLPGIKLVQVVHVTGPDSVTEALAVASEVDALLLDSGRPDLPVKELGGTGRRHDWSLSRRIREASPKPVFLAGGLTRRTPPRRSPKSVRSASTYAQESARTGSLIRKSFGDSCRRREVRRSRPTVPGLWRAAGDYQNEAHSLVPMSSEIGPVDPSHGYAVS